MGKEIVRFHSIIWPAMLMSLGLPLPKHVFGHGWLLLDGGKMSKSKGNVVDPYVLAEKFGVDALRFFLHAHLPLRLRRQLLQRAADPAPSTWTWPTTWATWSAAPPPWCSKYFGGTLPAGCRTCGRRRGLATPSSSTLASGLRDRYEDRAWTHFAPHNALDEVFKVIQRANKYIDENAPWALAKDMEANGARLAHVLYNLLEATRICGILLTPFIPDSLRQALRPDRRRRGLPDLGRRRPVGQPAGDRRRDQGRANLFPRVDMDKALAELEASRGRRRRRPPSPPWSWSPSSRRRWTLTPSANLTSGW